MPTIPFLPILALGLLPAMASAQASDDRPTEVPYELCLDAVSIGAIDLPYEIGDILEADDESTRVDYYSFAMEPGLSIVADMTDQATEPNTLGNPLLGLFGADCERIAYNDDYQGSLDAHLEFDVPADGTFILAAAASPDTEFDGSSDDIGAYTLRLELSPLPTPPIAAPEVTIVRTDDGSIEIGFIGDSQASGYNVYRDSRYVITVRPPTGATSFFIDGSGGDYCVVAFIESDDGTRYSPCGTRINVEAGGLEAGPPSTVQELRAVVYSPGVAELFWEPANDDGRVVTYRVLRDDSEVTSRDARSYFMSDLEPTLTYRFSVVAVDDEGNEGAPARLDFRAALPGGIPPTGGDGDAPAPPGSLDGTFYSPGVAEIFWTRSPDDARLAGYEVSRDGERVAFHKGSSHFEPRLATNRAHEFEVVAVEADGDRSTAVSLRLEPLGTDAIINLDTYADLIAHAFDVFVGDLYNKPYIALKDLDLSAARVSRDSSSNPVLDVYECESGGAELSLLWSSTNYGNLEDWQFDACLQDGVLYNGDISVHDGSYQVELSSEALTLQTGQGMVTSFSGHGTFWYNKNSRLDETHAWETTNLTLDSRSADGGDLFIDAMTSSFEYETFIRSAASMQGTFTVRSDVTGGTLLSVSTPIEFTYPSSQHNTAPVSDPLTAWNFTRGQLELVAEDGSRLVLDADTDDSTTVRIMIVNDLGVETFETDWSPWHSLLRFDRYPNEMPDASIDRQASKTPTLSD